MCFGHYCYLLSKIKRISLVVEAFNLEIKGRKAYFTSSEVSFFIEQHIQNPLRSLLQK